MRNLITRRAALFNLLAISLTGTMDGRGNDGSWSVPPLTKQG